MRGVLWILSLAFLVLMCPFCRTSASEEDRPRLAILDFRPGKGMESEEARTLTGKLRAYIHATGKFTLINREDMESIAKNHEVEIAICKEDACLLELGMLLGAQKLLVGDVGELWGKYTMNVRLVDIASSQLRNERVHTADFLPEQHEESLVALAQLLAGRQTSDPLPTSSSSSGQIKALDEQPKSNPIEYARIAALISKNEDIIEEYSHFTWGNELDNVTGGVLGGIGVGLLAGLIVGLNTMDPAMASVVGTAVGVPSGFIIGTLVRKSGVKRLQRENEQLESQLALLSIRILPEPMHETIGLRAGLTVHF